MDQKGTFGFSERNAKRFRHYMDAREYLNKYRDRMCHFRPSRRNEELFRNIKVEEGVPF